MEKKKYITPECEIIEMEGAVYMQAGSFDEGFGEDIENGTTETNRHRGEWGNLWGTRK